MLQHIVNFSLKNRLIVLLFTLGLVVFGLYSLSRISIGAVPDITTNQVQVITTSRNLSTQDVEQFITYPVELEMANLPGVTEIRSISKFGLSVVTIVFEDQMGTYLPRQLIAEKIKSATENIPEGFGRPEMGPISTGLGEIYQYVLDVDSAYRDQYTVMDLRTIQDWIIKRQLSGIPGVVEVNTWGGFLKQYEVTLNPDRLKSLNLTVVDVFSALDKNNHVAGGGYIEKENQSYFIRGEGLIGSVEDVEHILVKQTGGTPIYISDVGSVDFGYATRFGAITGNGEGEKVLGQVMMLKDANSNAVIEAVKKRVSEISTTLPPGVSINPFLERSELIAKTTGTITENLVFGCLIVVFVVVLLLGNIRSGLVVASIIPLSLLFAISLMYLFKIDANLMSLGAIDFGIIIDGAVIIVEYIAYQIHSRRNEIQSLEPDKQNVRIGEITSESTTRMMKSAIFGQIIIIIVFIPILSLSNVEGKLFIPMALTFCFALIGAMILGFTYVPVISSLLIRPGTGKDTISDKLIRRIKALYLPILERALASRRAVLVAAGCIVISAAYLFSTLGGEFVPTLDEGDFVIQPVLKTGTSLSKTVETTTRIENVIRRFPEVDQVVTRIGAAEVPTDPMSMEETDVIITLKGKDSWTSANTKDELAGLVKTALIEELPGVDFEFTQPIEMRFNELITGVRSDVAIKIFGEDLNLLYEKALAVEKMIDEVPGAADITVEKVVGLPQMRVKYDRSKIARYGLNIADVNRFVSLGFAGEVAGSVFEGEKRFDLKVRFHEDFRKDIKNLETVFISVPGGGDIPLSAVADIDYTHGPAKISRDNTKRRIVVSVNVRGRDLQSVVDDARNIIDSNLKLPPGYYITYGGQFENLESAKKRLAVAVPVALFLIFMMLFIAFKSLKETLMVFSAIPLAAVGGLLLLWIRGLPFSISAGVGFIALFGIAVLNGIVLIDHFKELKNQGVDGVKSLVIKGATQRLRPVLLTASAAALGFLPMAISTSPGAEVQRPLATVVIGGLITATLLTLVVLPVLYSIFAEKKFRIGGKLLFLALCFLTFSSFGQVQKVKLPEAIALARANNLALNASSLKVKQAEQLTKTAVSLDKTNVYYNYDQNNLTPNDQVLRVWGFQQEFEMPVIYKWRKQQLNSLRKEHLYQYAIEENNLIKEVSRSFYHIIYLRELLRHHGYLDSIYSRFEIAAQRRFELGETNYLELLTAQSEKTKNQQNLRAVQHDLNAAVAEFHRWVQTEEQVIPEDTIFSKVVLALPDTSLLPGKLLYKQSRITTKVNWQLSKQLLIPVIQLEYFQGTELGENSDLYQGFQVGISLPLFNINQRNQIKSAKMLLEERQLSMLENERKFEAKVSRLMAQLNKFEEALKNYESFGKPVKDQLLKVSNGSFQNGEIDFFDYVQSMQRITQMELENLSNLWGYNLTVLELNYLTF